MSPERTKRSHGKLDCSEKATGFLQHAQKRQKTVKPPRQPLSIAPINHIPEPVYPVEYYYPVITPAPFLQSPITPFDPYGSLQQQQQQFMPYYGEYY